MDPFSFEELFPQISEEESPGSHLYLYRLLQLAAGADISTTSAPPPSYPAIKKLAERLNIASGSQLAALFRDLGLGKLGLEISQEHIMVTLGPARAAKAAPTVTARKGPAKGACELERGLIDGALGLITGVPVTTVETRCRTRGDENCCFEAILDNSAGRERFMPGSDRSANGLSITGGIRIPLLAGSASGANIGSGSLKGWFMDLAGRELARARRYGRQLTVMYVDLDDLGQINAAHGRAAGDQVLRAVGAALSRSCRSEDFLWHQGEDEFAIILSETGTEGAGIVANRLSTVVLSAAEYVDFAARISASIGFSIFPVHAEDVPGLFNSARSALYQAKSMGKGRYQIARRFELGQMKDSGDETESQPEPEAAGAEGQAVMEAGRRKRAADGSRESETAAGGADPANEAADTGEPAATIIVASSSPLLMAGMTQVLAETPSLEIVAEIVDPGRLRSVIADLRPDLIFIDQGMATYGDFEAIKLLRDQNLACKMTVFASEVDQDVIKLAADYSVEGIILQDSDAADIQAALKTIFKGRTVHPPSVHEAMSELNKNRRLLKELSEREVEVLRLVAEGKSNSQISNELFITVNTVRFHLANIYQKLSVSNRTEAANYYLRQDLAPDGQARLL